MGQFLSLTHYAPNLLFEKGGGSGVRFFIIICSNLRKFKHVIVRNYL
jgi:hypothetical protein